MSDDSERRLDYDEDGFRMTPEQVRELDDWFQIDLDEASAGAGLIICHVGRWIHCR